jgi:signal transduction histidine kinase/streptogramin lyase
VTSPSRCRATGKRLFALRSQFSSVLALLVIAGPGYSSEADARVHPIRLPVVEGNDIRFTQLNFEQGLLEGEVNHILQDDQGFMWFGTSDGLRRYDGYGFQEYRHNPRDPNSLSGATIYALFKDRSGKLWVGSDAFLDMFDPASGKFTHFSGPGTAGIDGLVLDISQDRNGMLWIASYHGLYRLDPATWQIAHYQHKDGDPSSLSSNLLKCTFEEKDGTFWVATTEGLDVFDRSTGKVTRHISLMNGKEPLRISLLQDHAGVLWATFSSKNGLAVVDRAANRVTQYSFGNGSGQNTGVDSIYEDLDGTLWLGTGSSGLLKLDRDRRQFVRYRSNPRDPESLGAGLVLAVFQGREGSIWAGTREGGVSRFDRRPSPFQTYQPQTGSSGSPDVELSPSVFEDRRGVLWIGSQAVRDRIEERAERFSSYRDTGEYGSLFHSAVRSIAEDHSGSLWFGTYSGLNRIDVRTRKFKAYLHNPADPQSLSDNDVPSLFVDHKGVLWVGTRDGLDAFDPATERFRVYRASGDGLNVYNVYQVIAEDSHGALWLGTQSTGLQRFDPSTGHFTIYRNRPGNAGSLSNDQVNAIYIDASGIIWMGTQSGLNRFDPVTQTFSVYYERDGLPNNRITGILEDVRGNLWLSTSNGLSRFDPRAKTFANYSTSDGIVRGNIYGPHAGCKGSKGEMFFASSGGVIAFFPEKVVDNSYIPPVVLTDFRLYGKPVGIGGESPLRQSITVTDSITLPAAQNMFSLEFSVLSYVSPKQNRYRYRLEELDTGWNETSSARRMVTYTTLPPGDYVFRVRGSNNRGLWNEKGVALTLHILPPWWSTWWFRAIVGIALGLSLLVAYQARIHQLTREFNARLEERVNERTRIARELHDTLLQSFQGLLLRFQAAYEEIPARAEARKTLGNAIDRAAQAIAEGRDAVRGLRSSTVETNDLALALKTLGEELADHEANGHGVESFVEVEGSPRHLHPILRDEIYRIAGEAMRNAFRHAQARRIEVAIGYGERQLRLRVRDNGRGIDPEILAENGRAGHWGLAGMRERAEVIGGRLEVWSERQSGTEVELTVPASIAYATSPARRRSRLFSKTPFERKTGTDS